MPRFLFLFRKTHPEEAVPCVQTADLLHLCAGQRKIENVQIFQNMLRTDRPRGNDIPFLNMPAKDDLRICLAVFRREL